MQLHPQEALLQQARALQQSEAFTEYRQRRVVVEHRLARLIQLGIRQSRYFGRIKTRFQLYLAATVANLTPGGRQSRYDGRNRLRPQCRQRPGRWNGQLRHRMARANLDPHPARIGLADQIPLPKRGFPSEFLGGLQSQPTSLKPTEPNPDYRGLQAETRAICNFLLQSLYATFWQETGVEVAYIRHLIHAFYQRASPGNVGTFA